MKPFDVYPLYDITPVKAKGSMLWDKDGKEYLDLYGGHAVISIGHSHPHYISKIENQLNNIAFYSNAIKMPLQEELATKLGELSGYSDYDLFLSNSGAEANENALKLASFYNGRKKIIVLKNSFHGRTSLAVAATDNAKIVAPVNAVDFIEFVEINDEQALKEAIDDTVCALMFEGIQGVGGIHIPTKSYLQLARELCDKHDVVLILDEVQSGYGRSGKFFAHQYADIKPDLITIAKGMGNGFPVAGTLVSPKFEAKHGLLGTTFGGNYLACSAALAVLEVIDKENLIENAASLGQYTISALSQMKGVREVRGQGLMIGISLANPCAPLRKALLLKHGIFTGSASDPNTLRLLPALNVSKEHIDQFLAALEEELQSVVAS